MLERSLEKTATKDSAIILGAEDHEDALINRVAQEIIGGNGIKASDAAPESTLARYGITTAKGIGYIPQGVWNSVVHNVKNPGEALTTLGMGAGMALVLKTVLPETGMTGKIAAAAMGAYFTYKAAEPVFNAYQLAGRATTWGELDQAGRMIGDAGGSFIVNSAIAGVGYKVGAGIATRALASPSMAGFVEARANFYNRVDNALIGGYDKVSTFGRGLTDRIGLTEPRHIHEINGQRAGVIPPYLLEELSRRDPSNPAYRETYRQMIEMRERTQGFRPRIVEDTHGAREVYDAKGKEVLPGQRARFEGEKPTGVPDVDNAYDYTGQVRDFFKKEYNRNSIDGRGMKYVSTVNYGQNYENAFWDGKQMTYGRPGPNSPFKTFVLLDIAGHEITHGITEMEAATRYFGQAGALNEHYSDVFGSLIKQHARGQTAKQADWLVGEGIWRENVKGKALRDMRNPGSAYNDPAIGKDPQPAHMDNYYKTRGDNGGVHYNSGIPNRAFSTFAQEVGGNAWQGPGQIWYAARKAAGSNPSFAQFAYHTIEAAKVKGFANYIPKLESAWNSVGITPSATAVDVLTPGSGWGEAGGILGGLFGAANRTKKAG